MGEDSTLACWRQGEEGRPELPQRPQRPDSSGERREGSNERCRVQPWNTLLTTRGLTFDNGSSFSIPKRCNLRKKTLEKRSRRLFPAETVGWRASPAGGFGPSPPGFSPASLGAGPPRGGEREAAVPPSTAWGSTDCSMAAAADRWHSWRRQARAGWRPSLIGRGAGAAMLAEVVLSVQWRRCGGRLVPRWRFLLLSVAGVGAERRRPAGWSKVG